MIRMNPNNDMLYNELYCIECWILYISDDQDDLDHNLDDIDKLEETLYRKSRFGRHITCKRENIYYYYYKYFILKRLQLSFLLII